MLKWEVFIFIFKISLYFSSIKYFAIGRSILQVKDKKLHITFKSNSLDNTLWNLRLLLIGPRCLKTNSFWNYSIKSHSNEILKQSERIFENQRHFFIPPILLVSFILILTHQACSHPELISFQLSSTLKLSV